MSITTVEAAIRHARDVITEWGEEGYGFDKWLEVHTRYAVIDPIILALGWNTDAPKECHPEYPRWRGEEVNGWVDYAMFGQPDIFAIGERKVAPNVIVEAKSLSTELAEHVEQLQRYVEAAPRMRKGVAVLTNGREWWLYNLDRRGAFQGKRLAPINILEGALRESARTLNERLDRRRFG